MRKPKKSLKRTLAALAKASRRQAKLGPPTFGPFDVQFDPEFLEVQGTWYSVKELGEAVIAQKKSKRGKGRPAIQGRFEILDAAARVKASDGHYSKLAARFKLTPKQLTDLVQTNRPYFNRKLREYRRTTK